MIISSFLLLLLLILPNNYQKIYLQKQQSQSLKFIASILVVLGHQTTFYCNTSNFVKSETGLGDLCVAFFLFISGYGLLFGFLNKGCMPLTFSWLLKKLFKLIIPALTAMLIYTITKVCLGKFVDWSCLITWWFVSNTNLLYGWYVTEIMILYLFFFIYFHYLRPQIAFKMLCTTIVLAITIMIIAQVPIWYIKGLPCFILGLILAKFDAKGIEFKKKSTFILFSTILCLMIFYLLKDFHLIKDFIPFFNKWRYTYLSFFFLNIFFILIIINILMRLPSYNKIQNKGEYYYEIYLVQGSSLLICRELIENDIVFIITGIFITIILAKLINKLNQSIINVLTKMI